MTLNIYKFNYKFYGTTYSLCFSLSKENTKQIDDWNLSLDKIVLDEQLRTGNFLGKFQIDDDLKSLLEKMKEQGIIQPYYGMINPRSYIYTLQILQKTCKVEVTHTVMEQKISIEEPLSIHRFKLFGNPVNGSHRLMVKKQEYKKLTKWKFWNPKEEFTARYIYKFLPTSVGLGIKVLDVNSNEEIDITDYKDW